MRTSNQEVSELDKRIRLALQAAKMTLWEFNMTTGEVRWSGKVTQHFYDFSKSFDGSIKTYLQLIHPDDQEQVMNFIQVAMTDKTRFFNQHRVRWPDGKYHWLEGMGEIIEDDEGLKMSGSVQDITEKKIIQEDLNEWKAKYEMIAKSTGMVFYDYDVMNGDLGWSGDVEQVFGYQEEKINNIEKWEKAVHPDDRKVVVEELTRCEAAIKPYDIEYRFKVRSGSFRYFHDRGFFLERDNQAVRMLGMMNDVTDRKSAVEALKESENRFKQLIQDLHVGISLYDPSSQPITCNKAAYELLGLTEDQLLGKSAYDPYWKVVREDGAEFPHDEFPIPIAIETKKPVRGVVMGVSRPKTKDLVWLHVNAEPIFESSGKIRHVIVSYTDITTRKNYEEGLNQKNIQLREITESLRLRNNQLLEFAQIVSHNLRAPIANISGLISMIEKDPEMIEVGIGKIKEVSGETLQTLSDLNEVLQVQQAKGIETIKVSLEAELEKVLQSMKVAIQSSNTEISHDFKEANAIDYSPKYMHSIFSNLISNGIKYAAPGTSPQIHLQTILDENGNVVLQVQDQGIGLDVEKYRDQIFQLGKTFHSINRGKGVGLFHIKNQIQIMGGEIDVKSDESGTTFSVQFNRKPQ